MKENVRRLDISTLFWYELRRSTLDEKIPGLFDSLGWFLFSKIKHEFRLAPILIASCQIRSFFVTILEFTFTYSKGYYLSKSECPIRQIQISYCSWNLKINILMQYEMWQIHVSFIWIWIFLSLSFSRTSFTLSLLITELLWNHFYLFVKFFGIFFKMIFHSSWNSHIDYYDFIRNANIHRRMHMIQVERVQMRKRRRYVCTHRKYSISSYEI